MRLVSEERIKEQIKNRCEKLYDSLFHICKLKKIERIQSYYTFPYLSHEVI